MTEDFLVELELGRPKIRFATEGALEQDVLNSLTRASFIAHHASQRRYATRCDNCHSFVVPRGGMGETTGLPDVVTHKDRWPEGILLGIELKKDAKSKVRPEQVERLREGCSVIVYSTIAAVEYAVAVDELLRAIPQEAKDRFKMAVSRIADLVVRDTEKAKEIERRFSKEAKEVRSFKRQVRQARKPRVAKS